MDIHIPYSARAVWEREIHPALGGHRFAVLVAHRRFGKTVGALCHMFMSALSNGLPMPRYAYIAPYRAQAKAIAWNYLKNYTAPLVNAGTTDGRARRRVNESELSVTLPTRHARMPGALMQIHGADNPDSLRGAYWDGVILDEYAQMKRELWEEVILPALSDRRGWALFIGTPKGQNNFYEMFELANRTPGWFAGMYRADETGIIEESELEMLKETMGEAAYRQEMLCDFTASANDILITIDLVSKACANAKKYRFEDIKDAPKVLGVDVARFGDDRSAAVLRQGLVTFVPWVWGNVDNVTLADYITQIIHDKRPDAVFVDAGRGEGVIDTLRRRGYEIMEVPFGGRALNDRKYANRVTEMYDKLKLWMMENGALPNHPGLKTELSARTYDFDTRGRMALEPKKKYKERMGESPDIGDALALTFAAPVLPRGSGGIIR